MFFKQKRKFAALPFVTSLLTAFGAMLLIIPGAPVHAAAANGDMTAAKAVADADTTANKDTALVAGLCEHHTEHTAECLAGMPCGHTHTGDCYSQTARCVHVHSSACGRKNTSWRECSHVCSEKSGCITSRLDCHHEHNEDCCYEEGSVCSYICGSCHENEQDNTASDSSCNNGRKSHHSSHHSRKHHC